ncbi:threonine synthase [Arcobacter sp. FWKO B]|uniref:threonine synthase n=1 Tax=Arcobacter sp. FWKO B TaxID=2593672 RepID=UPI0018A50A94|nr:threonine synthase [Arcobacter sp. FWKO B]QOG11996.1 threonine synthase [Arcobacter sp. FWKO B]
MNFIETRGNDNIKPKEVTFSQAILSPSASFGGLYIPKELPTLELGDIEKLQKMSYKEIATFVLRDIFAVDIDATTLSEAINLYDKFDDNKNPAPVVKVKDNLFVSELYHGPTRAFKDIALQPFGYILSSLAQKAGDNYLILAATSGDTGPAALSTFKNKPNIQVGCLYPDGGTSDVQRLQMVTEDGSNLKVLGIKGNFDDAQNALKNLLANESFKEKLKSLNIKLSAANSVNFGRIIFQIVYHFWSYIELLNKNEIKLGEKIYLTVPSGNFGNALGAYYAKKMGLPIEKILITSNENNILTEWINEGKYDLNNKHLVMTNSPAMDILKSSNIERILFDKFGSQRTKELMDDLSNKNAFYMSEEEIRIIQEDFEATYCDDEYCKGTINKYLLDGYLMDPHTATCIKAYETLKLKDLKMVVYSTAEWTKFSPTVLNAVKNNTDKYHDIEALKEIETNYDAKIPSMINDVFSKEIKHTTIINKDDIEKEIIKFIS